MLHHQESNAYKSSYLTSIPSQVEKHTYDYYHSLYQTQSHMLVRTVRFFGYKAFRWFRLTDTHLLLFPKKNSTKHKIIPLDSISFSETVPLLKEFTSCLKLEMPKNRNYWLHCKNQEEHNFLVAVFTKEKKDSPAVHILINNQTFNPKVYQQCMDEVENNENHVSHTNRVSQIGFKPFENKELLSEAYLKIETLHEENIVTETANEGFISVNQLKLYSDIYVKPSTVHPREVSLKNRSSHFKSLSIQCTTNFEVSKSEISNIQSGEANCMFIKDSSQLKFPLTPPLMGCSTKETQSGGYFHKISFPGERVDEWKTTMGEGQRLNATAIPTLFADTSEIVDDAEEIEQDYIAKRDESVNTIRTMEFNGVGKRKPYLHLLSRDESFIKTPLHTEPDRRIFKTNFDEEKAPMHKVSSSRLRDKVIGPRALMDSIGPSLEKGNEEQGAEAGTYREDVKEKISSSNEGLNYGEIGAGDKSPLCVSLIDPKSEIELQINSISDCITASHGFIWNYELQKAQDCLNMFREQDLFIELMIIESNMIEIAVSGSTKKIQDALDKLHELLNKVNTINISQKEPEKYFSNELNKAEIYIYRGVMHFFLGNKFQTIRAFAEGWRHYRKLENLIQKKSFKGALSSRSLHRFKFGYGCFNLIFSLIPPGLLKFMRLIGIMNPNKEKGLNSLEVCRNEGDIRSNYASIILALYNIEFEGALESACDIIKDSLKAYGKCPLFHWITSIICWKFAQAKDAYLMIKTALWHLKDSSTEAIYLVYELGWYHFINMNWEQSLSIFQKVISQALPMKFFKNQVADTTSLAKCLKLHIPIDFSNFQEEFNDIKEERPCILPHLPHIAVKIAVCNFYLGNYELAIKWLLSAIVIFKNYSNFKSRQEEDFSKLAVKFLKRSSLKMLVYEVIYLMRYLPKTPDQNLFSILEQVEAYQASLPVHHEQLESYLISKQQKDDALIVEYFSTVMIKIVIYCLLGDTDIACEIYKNNCKYLSIIPEDFSYLSVHIEYWVGRALISENRGEEARTMLKALLKRKKCDFSINTRIRRVLLEIK